LNVDPTLWLIAKFCEHSPSETDTPFTEGMAAELKKVFEYVGLPFTEPTSRSDFDSCVSLLREEVSNQNKYLFQLSKNKFTDASQEYHASKFVADIVNLNRRA
jgi:hypothetical protein